MQDYSIWPGWRLLMQDANIQASPVLRRAGLAGDLFLRTNVRLSPDNFFKLWMAIEAEGTSIDARLPVPLQIAKVMTTDWFDPELFAALCSANMRCALDRMAQYVRLIAPMVFRIDESGTSTKVTIDFLDKSTRPPSVFLIFKLIFFVQLARLATRSPINPVQVSWPSGCQSAKEALDYEQFFGVRITDSTLATLTFSTDDMQKPFLTENHKMWQFFEPSLRQRLSEMDRMAGTSRKVHSILLESLPAGETSMQQVSQKLAVSSRTLQRRLKNEGSSFQQILDEVRESLAVHYLLNTSMSGAEISFLLGFEDSNSFTRAFISWTGKNPQSVRANAAQRSTDSG
ncbi:helix-turn-helix domain-containing protein [Pantoea vagans]|uniref:AraC family transcriptional regulator n=1 Tax=Pantoea vagans TaxID=470934 RepID=UPI00224D80A0|nr:AraC family transcriptional regulator [Pantoea vagans]MCX3309058.1 helix-turn-helix domain-containing protein [Pantoea vagans]